MYINPISSLLWNTFVASCNTSGKISSSWSNSITYLPRHNDTASFLTLPILPLFSERLYNLILWSSLNNSLKNELIKNNINYSKFEWHKSAERYYKLSKSNIINLLLKKLNFKNPFIKFLEKKKIDLIFFLGPTNYINYCGNINFISNVYDLNHIFFNYFPEYRCNDIIEKTNHLIKRITNRSFCILANTEKTRQELITLFNCPEDKIKIYPYYPYLPKLFNKIKKNTNFENLLDKINIKDRKSVV
jgi:hypothetical protein